MGVHEAVNTDQTDTVLQAYLPKVGFLDALAVCLGKLALTIAGGNGCRKLSHWMHIARKVLEECHNVRWKRSSVCQFLCTYTTNIKKDITHSASNIIISRATVCLQATN